MPAHLRLASTDSTYVDVVNTVMNAVLRPRWPEASWGFGRLEINDFSLCIAGDRLDGDGSRGVYIKIPKRRITTTSISEIDDGDRVFGSVESRSLAFLSDKWPTAENVRYVELLGRIDRINALVTRRVYGTDFSELLRDANSAIDENLVNSLGRVGRSLVHFHSRHSELSFVDEALLAAKFARYIALLESFGIGRGACKVVEQLASAAAIKAGCRHSPSTSTLKGLDVRNLLIEPDGALVFLDPGGIKNDSPLADYARFAATLRLLYWGRLPFFLGRLPRYEYVRAFEHGYFAGSAPRAAHIFQLKELCKMWLMAHVALRDKGWPASFKRILRDTYVNRFFMAWLGELNA